MTPPLHILITNERPERIAFVTKLVVELGHVASIGSTDLAAIGASRPTSIPTSRSSDSAAATRLARSG